MKPLRVSEDILPIADFKSRASEVLRKMRGHGRPVVITQSGKPAAVLISPEYFDQLIYRDRFIAAVVQGLDDIEGGRVLSDEQLQEELDRKLGSLE
jgi:prevent-host-death family protein